MELVIDRREPPAQASKAGGSRAGEATQLEPIFLFSGACTFVNRRLLISSITTARAALRL